MVIPVSVTLREKGTWFIIMLSSHLDLLRLLNTGFYEGNQLFAAKFDMPSGSAVYDFVTKQWRNS